MRRSTNASISWKAVELAWWILHVAKRAGSRLTIAATPGILIVVPLTANLVALFNNSKVKTAVAADQVNRLTSMAIAS